MPAEADLLKEVPLFQLLDDPEREELASQMEVIRHAAGAAIFSVGDPGDAIYVISAGQVEVFFKNDTGERIVLEVAGRGEFFGELSLLDGAGRSASVVAVHDTETLSLNRAALNRFLSKHPSAAMDLLAAMGRRLRASSERLRHTATRNVNEEVADKRTVVQKSADWIAEFAGSITFLMLHVVWFGLWLGINSIPVSWLPKFDPFPFGFLTLTVSLEAIFLSVFVLLSQNRQAAKDRVRSDIEYDVNLKAELEICHLHEKVDRLNEEVLARLEYLQRSLPPPKGSPTPHRAATGPGSQPVTQ